MITKVEFVNAFNGAIKKTKEDLFTLLNNAININGIMNHVESLFTNFGQALLQRLNFDEPKTEEKLPKVKKTK